MTLNKKTYYFILCFFCLFLFLGTACAKTKEVGHEIKKDSKEAGHEMKDAGKSIGKESKKVGHDIKKGSKEAWQETKDVFK